MGKRTGMVTTERNERERPEKLTDCWREPSRDKQEKRKKKKRPEEKRLLLVVLLLRLVHSSARARLSFLSSSLHEKQLVSFATPVSTYTSRFSSFSPFPFPLSVFFFLFLFHTWLEQRRKTRKKAYHGKQEASAPRYPRKNSLSLSLWFVKSKARSTSARRPTHDRPSPQDKKANFI